MAIVTKRNAGTLILFGLAAGVAWSMWRERSRRFVVPGSKSTVPDHVGHYDMDGVSFDDDCGVVVSSDGRTPDVIVEEAKTANKEDSRVKLPRAAS